MCSVLVILGSGVDLAISNRPLFRGGAGVLRHQSHLHPRTSALEKMTWKPQQHEPRYMYGYIPLMGRTCSSLIGASSSSVACLSYLTVKPRIPFEMEQLMWGRGGGGIYSREAVARNHHDEPWEPLGEFVLSFHPLFVAPACTFRCVHTPNSS